jgi:predicted secreted protein
MGMIFKITGLVIIGLMPLQWLAAQAAFSGGDVTAVTKEDDGRTVVIVAGDVIQIELLGSPGTGFWWYFEQLDEEYLELLEEETRKTISETMLGAPMRGVWRLRARRPGETTVEMAYYRVWEKPSEAADYFGLTVRIEDRQKISEKP